MREEDGFRVTVKRTICTVKESELDIILVSLAYTSKSVVTTIYINHCIIIMVGGVGKVCSKVQVYTPSSLGAPKRQCSISQTLFVPQKLYNYIYYVKLKRLN